MEKNVGTIDKIIRVILAFIFAYLGYNYSAWWYILTVLSLLTAILGFCGPYKLLGINTCKGGKK